MIEGLEKFRMDLRHFHEVVVPETHLELQKKIVLKLHLLITTNNSGMARHPILFGWARSNWGQSLQDVPPTDDAEVKPGEYTTKVVDAMQTIRNAKPYGIIWEYNNTPYIVALENGHSRQAPTGIVENALNDLQEFIDKL